MVDSTKNTRFNSKHIKNAKRIIADAIRNVRSHLLKGFARRCAPVYASAHSAGAMSLDNRIFVELRRIRQWRISTQFQSRL